MFAKPNNFPCSDVKPEPVVTTAEPGPDNSANMPQTTVKGKFLAHSF